MVWLVLPSICPLKSSHTSQVERWIRHLPPTRSSYICIHPEAKTWGVFVACFVERSEVLSFHTSCYLSFFPMSGSATIPFFPGNTLCVSLFLRIPCGYVARNSQRATRQEPNFRHSNSRPRNDTQCPPWGCFAAMPRTWNLELNLTVALQLHYVHLDVEEDSRSMS